MQIKAICIDRVSPCRNISVYPRNTCAKLYICTIECSAWPLINSTTTVSVGNRPRSLAWRKLPTMPYRYHVDRCLGHGDNRPHLLDIRAGRAHCSQVGFEYSKLSHIIIHVNLCGKGPRRLRKVIHSTLIKD